MDATCSNHDINNNDSTPHARGNAANQAGSSFYPMKTAQTFEQQLSILRARGMSIDNDEAALERLQDLNYYRLRGYWLTLEEKDVFKEDASFESVWDIYQLDRELRQWLWRAIEPVEIKLRTQFAYHLAHKCGPTAYLNADFFKSSITHKKAISNYERELKRSYRQNVPYVVHNVDKYGELPVWAAVEIMSFGTLSMLYGCLKRGAGTDQDGRDVAAAVAEAFGTKQRYLKSWAHHLVTIRNIAAHHDRFYNRVINIRPNMLKRDVRYAGNKQFPTFLVIKRIYERSWPEEWMARGQELTDCICRHPSVDIGVMGFPSGWQEILDVL